MYVTSKGETYCYWWAEDKGTDTMDKGELQNWSNLNFYRIRYLHRIVSESGGNCDAKIEVVTTTASTFTLRKWGEKLPGCL